MKRIKSLFAMLLVATGFVSNAQDNQSMPMQPGNPGLIAVINSAKWCAICKANGERFRALIMSYTAKGVTIYMNDLTNDTTKAVSKSELEKANIYKAVTTIPRKGMGKMLKYCGLVKDKKQLSEVSGIVTFISPKTHKQLKQLSIASTDEEMKSAIEKYLQ
jgi:hypothetical protein